MRIKVTPEIRVISVLYNHQNYNIEYFYRKGNKETILFIHGLGGAKENYWEAFKSDVLADHTLIAFDNPETGNSTFHEDFPLDIDDLVSITALFIRKVNIDSFIMVGTSMGGLTTLKYLQSEESGKVKAYVNIEGNLMPEDCMFSSKVVQYDYQTFARHIFPETIEDMRRNGNTGYHIISNNLQMNTNVKAYYHYSFQTVEYSATGELLKFFISLKLPKIFIYGDKNGHLSYLPELVRNKVSVKSISESDHFIFYDNPKELYEVIGQFLS